MKHLRIAIAAAIAASTTIVLFGTAAASSDNPNDVSYWEGGTEHPAQCYKYDPPSEQTPHGGLTADGKAVVLNEFNPNWPGDHWELLVVKAGSSGGDGNGNAVYPHPIAGQEYTPPLNNGGEEPAVSHWIVCKGTTPDLVETSVSWTPTDGTCEAPAGSLAVDYESDEVSYTGDPAGVYVPGSSVDGSFEAEPGYLISGDAGPFDHEFSISDEPCVYHVTFEKSWSGDDAPDLDGATLLTATGSLGSAACTSDDGVLSCDYTTGDDLHVPFGETYSVAETVPAGWFVVSGTGDGFTGIVGFDESALPDVAYEIAADRFCLSDSNETLVRATETSCSHTVTNELADEKVVPAAPAFVDPTCVAPTAGITGADDTAFVDYEVTGTVAPGETVTVTATAEDGYELDPDKPASWEHTFGELDQDDCVIEANPDSSIETDCGSALLSFSNAVGAIPDGYTAETAEFIYTVDGESTTIELAPNESTTVPLGFEEDSGVHSVQLGDEPAVEIESNCELDEVTTAAPTFTDPTCDEPAASLDLPVVAGVTYETSALAAPGTTVVVTATAQAGHVLDGETEWTYDFKALDDLDCEEPAISVTAFSQVCRADVPYVEYDIEVTGTDADTAKLTFRALDGDLAGVYEDVPLKGLVIYPGASVDPQDWPGWTLNTAGFWVPDPRDADWREGLTVEVEINPTATASVTYPPASEACLDPEQEPPTTPPTVDTVPVTTTAIGQAGPTEPVTELPKTGSDATSGMVTIGALLLIAGGALIGATRRRSISIR